MKKQALTVVLGFSLLAFLVGTSAFAESIDEQINTDVPFSFVVGKTTLPAGSYTIRFIGQHDQVAMVIQSTDERLSVDFLTGSIEASVPPKDTYLLFEDINGKHVLSQVWLNSDNVGRQVIEPSTAFGTGNATHMVTATHSKRTVR